MTVPLLCLNANHQDLSAIEEIHLTVFLIKRDLFQLGFYLISTGLRAQSLACCGDSNLFASLDYISQIYEIVILCYQIQIINLSHIVYSPFHIFPSLIIILFASGLNINKKHCQILLPVCFFSSSISILVNQTFFLIILCKRI